jgi:hypothetical protein
MNVDVFELSVFVRRLFAMVTALQSAVREAFQHTDDEPVCRHIVERARGLPLGALVAVACFDVDCPVCERRVPPLPPACVTCRNRVAAGPFDVCVDCGTWYMPDNERVQSCVERVDDTTLGGARAVWASAHTFVDVVFNIFNVRLNAEQTSAVREYYTRTTVVIGERASLLADSLADFNERVQSLKNDVQRNKLDAQRRMRKSAHTRSTSASLAAHKRMRDDEREAALALVSLQHA